MVDFAEIFDGTDTPAPAPEPQPAEVPAPQPEQAEQPAPDAPPEAPPPAPEPAPQHEQDRMVPLTAMLDTRDKLKAAERRLAELEAAQQRGPVERPDPYDNPEGYDESVNARIIMGQLKMSKAIAMKDHGAETVESAIQWAAEQSSRDPGFEARMIAQDHPVEWVVRQQKQEADLSEYSKDPIAFARRILEANGQMPAPDAGAAVVAVPGQQQAQKPAAPPRSIASAAGAGSNRDVATGPLSAFGANFKA